MTASGTQSSDGIVVGVRPTDVAALPPPAAFATRRICPYLAVPDGIWRSSSPSHEHRCGAVAPPSLLTVEKQRRLCLSDRHGGCSTFLAAAGLPIDAARNTAGPEAPWPRDRRSPARASPDNRPGGETVTRWSIVRTRPVVLDHSRMPAAVASMRNRSRGQLVLGSALVAVFAIFGLNRLAGGGAPPLAGLGASASQAATAAALAATASPLAPSPSPSPSPSEPSPSPSAPPPTEPPASQPPPSQPPAATPAATPGATPAPAPVATTYRVRDGDTLYGIAARFGTSVKRIQQLNGMGSSTIIHAGDILKVG